MTKNRKILIGIIGTALFGIVFSFIQKPLNNRKVLKVIQEEISDDKFYFIRGLDRDRSLSTNIRYRGIVYSDKLKQAESFSGIQVALEDMDELWKYKESFKRQYEGALAYPLATAPMKENAKKIFGNDIIVYVDFPMIWDLKAQTEFVENNKGKETDQIVTMTGYIDVFVDDITKVDIDRYKKKLFELHQTLYKTYHIDSILHLDVQDKKYLTYEQIESNIFYIFKDEPKVKELLKKYKDNGNLNADEIGYLTNYFVKYFEDENASKISFESYSYFVKKYQDINVILPKEMRKID